MRKPSFTRRHLRVDHAGVLRWLGSFGAKDLPLWTANALLVAFRRVSDVPIIPISVAATAGSHHWRSTFTVLVQAEPPGQAPYNVIVRINWSEDMVKGTAESEWHRYVMPLMVGRTIEEFVAKNAGEIAVGFLGGHP